MPMGVVVGRIRRLKLALARRAGSAALALLLVMGAALLGRTAQRPPTSSSPWEPTRSTRLFAFSGTVADAAVPTCEDKTVKTQSTALLTYQGTQACLGRVTYYAATITEFCDEDREPIVVPPEPPSSLGICGWEDCHNPQCIAFPETCVPNQWALDGQVGSGLSCGTQAGSCCSNAPAGPTVICRNVCPPPAPQCPPGPACPDGECDDCALGNPVSLPAAELDSEFPLFPLGDAGFPAEFSLYWRNRKSVPTSNAGEPLGTKMLHSFSLFLWKHMDSAGIGYARATLEGGAVISFKYDPAVAPAWVGEEGRHGTLLAAPPGLPCFASARIELPSGDTYHFRDSCDGDSPLEGTIERIDRRNGDFLTFVVEPSTGLIQSVSNRRGQTVELAYSGPNLPAEAAHWGFLQSVKAPDGSVFRFTPGTLALGSIEGPHGILYTLEEDSRGQLLSVRDALDQLDHRWTYLGAAPSSESGPGESVGDNTVTIVGDEDHVWLTFDPAGPTSSVTNIYELGAGEGALPHVVGRDLLGSCPGCGTADLVRAFWPGTNDVRAVADGHGTVTAFLDWEAAGACDTDACHDLVYGDEGEARVVYEGCEGSVAFPDCSLGRRVEYSYLPGTRIVQTSSRPSAASGKRVTLERVFDGTSSRVRLERRTGWTTATLGGELTALRSRATRYTYGGGPAGVDVTSIDGPFDDDGSGTPPANAPRTEYAYYEPGEPDACGNGDVPDPNHNEHRLKSVTRFVDDSGSRRLATFYCSMDGAGRPGIILNADGTRSELSYDFRGNVTRTVVDGEGLHLVTDSIYDANGNLVELRLPRTTSKGRTGIRYLLNDADWVVAVQTGFFPSSGPFVVQESMTMEYDPWGNRVSTTYRNAAGTPVTSETASYDAFNRLKVLERGSAPRRTSFDYDDEGNLTSVRDAQSDLVSYGSVENLDRYDRFGRLSRVQQKICDRPFTDPEDPCFPYPANVDYGYDGADQLRQVDLEDTVRGGTITTSYVVDDFGQTVQVTSPDSGTSASRFDGSGRLIESRDARGKVFRYEYDRLSRLVRKVNVSPVTVVAADGDHGSVTVDADGNVGYTPDADFSGTDSFDFTVSGRNGDTANGTAVVTVNPVNDPPIARSKTAAGVVGTSAQFVIRAEDIDSCELSFSLVSAPTLGTVNALESLPCIPGVITHRDEARVTYTGSATGFDEFVFEVTDGEYVSQSTVFLVVTESGSALLGVSTEAYSALGPDLAEALEDGSCTSTPCALESYSDSAGPASGSFAFARASRGSLAAKSAGTAQTGTTPEDASFAALGSSFFVLPDLVFTSTDPTVTEVCPGGLNLVLNGSLASELAGLGGTVFASVAVRIDIAGTPFVGTLVWDGATLFGTGLLEGAVDTANLVLTTPGFCVPVNENAPLTVELASAVDAELYGADLSADARADYANTLSFPDAGPVFVLPPGASADAASGGIEDNLWVAQVLPVAIDVKPGNPENVIPCGNSKALIPTALLTTEDFDALSVDADTIRFEGGGEIHRDHDGRARRHAEDADGDGDLDLVFHFRLSDTNLTCASQVGSLTGTTSSGLLIVGSDLLTMKAGGGP